MRGPRHVRRAVRAGRLLLVSSSTLPCKGLRLGPDGEPCQGWKRSYVYRSRSGFESEIEVDEFGRLGWSGGYWFTFSG